MKYVVICTYDREIIKVGQADYLIKATEILQDDFLIIFFQYYDDDDFNNNYERSEKWELKPTEAWINTDKDYNYDWRIIEVD